jgi:two-component system sensor histidine kinase/response regulator
VALGRDRNSKNQVMVQYFQQHRTVFSALVLLLSLGVGAGVFLVYNLLEEAGNHLTETTQSWVVDLTRTENHGTDYQKNAKAYFDNPTMAGKEKLKSLNKMLLSRRNMFTPEVYKSQFPEVLKKTLVEEFGYYDEALSSLNVLLNKQGLLKTEQKEIEGHLLSLDASMTYIYTESVVAVQNVALARQASLRDLLHAITVLSLFLILSMFALASFILKILRQSSILKSNENRLRLALAVTKQGWFDLNVQTGMALTSPEYAKLLGHQQANFRSDLQGWQDSLHPDDHDAVMAAYRKCLSDGSDFSAEYRRRTKNGGWLWFNTTGEIIEWSSLQQPLRLIGIHTEITENKKREAEIAEAQAEVNFQKHALDEHAIVSIADVAGDITYVNEKFCKISGYSKEELLGQNNRAVKSDKHSSDFYLDLWKTIANGETWRGEIKNKIKGGGYYWVNATIVPTLNDNGKPVQYVAISNDITAEKKKEFALIQATEEAQEANLTKTQFLAAMSHEIRTPMAGVIGMSDLLLDTDLSPQQLDWATSIKSSGQNLMSILNEILDQSKLETGKLELSPTDFHLASFIRDNIQLFGPSITSKGLALDIKLDSDLPEAVHADSLRIGQVLSNFLSNALKFTSTGQIGVTVKPELNELDEIQLLFTVTDSGIGLTDEEINRLFTAFTQADSSTSRTYGGTGLGLSISKQLVELMGGQIGVDSTKGIGSAFWFTVCCQPAKEAVVATDKRVNLDRWVASRSLNILVAEDNSVNQYMIRAILNKLDHSVEIAKDGQCAIDLLNTGDFDLILMDIRMPVMDGLEATASIRAKDGSKSNIPIIALTADISAGNINEYTTAGMNDVCGKPIELAFLLRSINKCLGEEIHTSTSHGSASAVSQQPADASIEE